MITSTSSPDTVAVVHGGLHDAALIVTAVAIVRRMVSDEALVEAAVQYELAESAGRPAVESLRAALATLIGDGSVK